MKHSFKPAITFDTISLSIDNRQILTSITGSFPKASITTIVGPSGSGKSTILKLCNRLSTPSSGEITIDGLAIESFNPIKLRQKIGIALQSGPMIKGTVYDNLNLPKLLHNSVLSKEEALVILSDVGLDDTYLEKDASSLSGGQKQRVSIARTLINQSEILLLDEITSALDPRAVKEIEELIIKINKKYGVTIIWVTHNLQQATRVGHYTWILIEGKLVEYMESKQLFSSQNEQVKQFLNGGL